MTTSVIFSLHALPYWVLFAYMCGLFIIALWKKDNSIADIGYGGGFIVAAGVAALVGSPNLLTLLVLLWGGRLAFRIYQKNKGKPEDFRYAAWRKEWTWFRTRSFFQVFMLQGIIIAVIVAPVVVLSLSSLPLPLTKSALFSVALVLWLIGYFFEVVGDAQLDRFIKDPGNKGKLMTRGLWRYTRHPNYFGESLMWWAIWLMASSAHPSLYVLGVSSPILITFLLLRVSGIPLLEARMKEHPNWDAYAKATNAFIPWIPKKTTPSVDKEIGV